MGRGQGTDRPILAVSRDEEAPQMHYMRWPSAPSYTLRARSGGVVWPMIVHMVDRLWAAGTSGTFIHTPFEDECACGKGSICETRRTLDLAYRAKYTLPLEARSLRPYVYKRPAPGLAVGFARQAEEIPLFICTLADGLVTVTGARLPDAVVADGRCSHCSSEDCAHIEAAAHADAAGAELTRPTNVTSEVIPGMVAFAEVEQFPDRFGFLFAAVIDWAARTEQFKAMAQMQKEMEAAQQREIRAALLEQLRAEKEAKGETFDASEYKTDSDEDPAPSARTEWDRKEDPTSGYALIIVSMGGGVMWSQPLRSPTECACGEADCAHADLLDRMAKAPQIEREARADQVAAEQAKAAATKGKSQSSLPTGATAGTP